MTIIQIHSEIDFPVSERRIVFEAELRFLFGRTEAEHQILRNAFIILPVFSIAVVQITVTVYHRLHMLDLPFLPTFTDAQFKSLR